MEKKTKLSQLIRGSGSWMSHRFEK